MYAFIPRPGAARRGLVSCALFGALLAWLPSSHAALTISNTRIVFDSDKRSTSVTVANPSKSIYAAQAWINTVEDDQSTAVPFIASPPLFRLNPGKEQQVQINRLPNALPMDRESLFFFNVQELPQADKDQKNALNVALRSRIKLFYRPKDLPSKPEDSFKTLSWAIRTVDGKQRLQVHNPSPYHVSFVTVELLGNGQKVEITRTPMASPMSTQVFDLEGFKPAPGAKVNFSAITDYGGYTTPSTMPVTFDN